MSIKFYLEALRKLPEEYIADDTKIATLGKDSIVAVVIVRPMMAPLICDKVTGEWKELQPIKLSGPPAPEKVKGN